MGIVVAASGATGRARAAGRRVRVVFVGRRRIIPAAGTRTRLMVGECLRTSDARLAVV
jgi:hypothetical protein